MSILLFLSTLGCIRAPVQLMDATSHLEGIHSYEELEPAVGKACQFNLFYLIPIGGNQMWKAKEKAIGDADGLVDVSVDSAMGFPIIGYVLCTEIRGTRYRLVSQPMPAPEPTVLPAPEPAPIPEAPPEAPPEPEAAAVPEGEAVEDAAEPPVEEEAAAPPAEPEEAPE